MRDQSKGRSIQSVARAMEMLRFIGEAGRPVHLTQLSKGLGLSVSTVHGILNTMKRYDVICQDPETGRYFLGIALLQLGGKVQSGLSLHQVCLPHLTALSERYGETVHLAVRSQAEAVFIDHVEGRRVHRLTSRVGERRPLHCCSVGKAMLAFLDSPQLEALLRDMPLQRFTPHTLASPAALRENLARIRSQGYAVDREETETGLCGVAAPLRNHAGEVVAAISIGLPVGRLLEHGEENLGFTVRATAAKISAQLGWTSGTAAA